MSYGYPDCSLRRHIVSAARALWLSIKTENGLQHRCRVQPDGIQCLSPLTLTIMLGVVAVFIPIVLAYQAWTYNLFKAKTTLEDLAYEDAY